MKTITNMNQMIINEIESEISLLKKGILYCEEMIKEASSINEKWAVKEYQQVISDDETLITSLSKILSDINK